MSFFCFLWEKQPNWVFYLIAEKSRTNHVKSNEKDTKGHPPSKPETGEKDLIG